jgi:hypothetical protein
VHHNSFLDRVRNWLDQSASREGVDVVSAVVVRQPRAIPVVMSSLMETPYRAP